MKSVEKISSEIKNYCESAAENLSFSIKFLEPLSRHTSYQIGGPASAVAFPQQITDLKFLSKIVNALKIPFYFLGAGSNFLAPDEGFPGLIIKSTKLPLETKEVGLSEGKVIEVSASLPISMLLNRAIQNSWAGLECLAGIPGTVGGVVFMNGGTHLGETASILDSVRVFSLLGSKEKIFTAQELSYSYRENHFLNPDDLVLSASFKTLPGDGASIKKRVDELLMHRKNAQPITFPSCGSVFRNPKEMPAWKVVDTLGLRGHRIGGAEVSTLHSNWILNLDHAKASDVLSLIELIEKRAKDELGIVMKREIRVLYFS